MKRVASLLAVIFFLSPVCLFSQKSNFRHFSIQDGLPQSSVFTMIQDSRGYIWLGTLGGGASRFDGTTFVTFNTTNGLSGNVVRAIFEDSLGNLWFGTDQGLTIYDGFSFNSIDTASGLLGNQVLCFHQASDRSIWVGTDLGLNRLEWLGNDSVLIRNIGSKQGFPYSLIFDIYEDPSGKLWLATYHDGVIIIGYKDDQLTSIEGLNQALVPVKCILDITPDNNGNIWLGTGGAGAYRITIPPDSSTMMVDVIDNRDGLEDLTVYNIVASRNGTVWLATGGGGTYALNEGRPKHYGKKEGAPSDQILCLLEDQENQMWAGSNDNGFFRFMGDYFVHFDEETGLPHNAVKAILQDRQGAFWLTSYGGGLTRLRLTDQGAEIHNFGESEGIPDLKLNDISLAPNGDLWIASNEHGILHYNGQRFVNLNNLNGLADNHVNTILADSKGFIWCGTNTGICKYNGNGFFCLQEGDEFGLVNDLIQTLFEDSKGNIWAGTDGGLIKFTSSSMTSYDEKEGLNYKKIQSLAEDSLGDLWIGTFGGGLYRFDTHTGAKVCIRKVESSQEISSDNIESLLFPDRHTLIVGTDKGFDRITLDDSCNILSIRNYDRSDGFIGQENNMNAICLDASGRIWFGTARGLTCYDRRLENDVTVPPVPFLTEIRLSYESVDWKARSDSVSPWTALPYSLRLPFSENHITFYFKAISLGNPEKLRYRYRLLERDTIWSPARKETQVTYSGLAPGEYIFELSAQNESGAWSKQPFRYRVLIRPPFYRTWWFILLAILAILFIIFSYIKLRERNLIREKRELEVKVNERTLEIRKQKAVIEEKNVFLEKANTQITSQKELIEQKNRDITASIQYAKRIQDAILPSQKVMQENLVDSFILYKPKDIVSGDFYWIRKKDHQMIVVAADCTGHGVPGAFMSMLGISFLDEIVDKEGHVMPADILNKLRDNIILALKQKELQSETKDGMDISICCLDLKKNLLEFSGANNPMYIVRKGGLIEVPCDHMPVAIHEKMDPFTDHHIRVEPGDQFYMFSDGYADQFGGPDGKKLKYKPFKDLILAVQDQPMLKQKKFLEDSFEAWRKSPDYKTYEQVDDVVIVGFRVI
jgi:ligand-binding sensor domain-containing protein/serine phosphatase RsbU (regulator of sigma subunit)